jgi:transposase-like protein
MATDHRRAEAELVQGPLLDDPSFLKEIVQRVVQELLELQMTEHIGAAPYERNATRSGQRNGHKPRTLRTRVGTLNLLVPQDLKRGLSAPGSSPATSETRRHWLWR